jgi:CheY-like chemotaxis protein
MRNNMPGSPPLILLVEDEPEISTVISDILDDAGFRIEAASDYAEGVELLSASQPALLIANVLLPGGGDGYELAEAARRLGVPTLLVSGHPEAIVEGEARGHPFLAKPFQSVRIATGDPNPHRKRALARFGPALGIKDGIEQASGPARAT